MRPALNALLADLARHGASLTLENGRVGVQGELPAELLLRLHRYRRDLLPLVERGNHLSRR
jgi:hypothetical protein